MEYLYADPNDDVPPHVIQQVEANASSYWDMFYQCNRDKFYKDREFKDLASGPAVLLEVGCGAGNTVYPLLEVNPQLRIYACDFAPNAVQLVKDHPAYASGHVSAFVADLTRDDLRTHMPPASVDYVTMVFVMSAISPEHMPAAVANVARTMRTGGRLFFRDYADGDLTQERRQAAGAKRLGNRFYLRGDRTRCYYFQESELVALFAQAGLECLDIRAHDQEIENRKRDLIMSRRWVQAVFQLKGPPCQDVDMHDAPACTQQQQQQKQQGHKKVAPTAGNELDTGVKRAKPLALVSDGQGWLSGAAGRLASNLHAHPGVPSGRALLPDTLDSADECAVTLSPDARRRGKNSGDTEMHGSRAGGHHALACDVEKALEAEFFATVERNTQDVVFEELAAAGFAGITLSGPEFSCWSNSTATPPPPHPSTAQHMPPQLLPPGAPAQQPPQHTSSTAASHPPTWPKHPAPPQPPVIAIKDTVAVLPGLTLSRHWPQLPPAPPSAAAPCPAPSTTALTQLNHAAGNEVLLAGLLAHSQTLRIMLANAQVLQVAAGPGALAAATAVRVGAQRVLVTHPDRSCLACLASSLHENRSKVVIERLRVTQLLIGGDPALIRNAYEQAFPCSSMGEPGQHQHGKIILCADLSTAVAAEVACIQQSRRSGPLGASGSGGAEEGDVSLQGLSAVLLGAWQLACSGAEPGEKGKLVRTVHPRNLTHARRAARQGDESSNGRLGARMCHGSVFLILVQEGHEAGVASAAQACGWGVDVSVSAQLLHSIQGIGEACSATARVPLFLRAAQMVV